MQSSRARNHGHAGLQQRIRKDRDDNGPRGNLEIFGSAVARLAIDRDMASTSVRPATAPAR